MKLKHSDRFSHELQGCWPGRPCLCYVVATIDLDYVSAMRRAFHEAGEIGRWSMTTLPAIESEALQIISQLDNRIEEL